MDGLSHVLVGLSIAAASPEGLTLRSGIVCGVLALAPDFFLVPLALVLWRRYEQTLWIPQASDWAGARPRYPCLSAWSWNAPYSILGVVVVCGGVEASLGWPAALAYFSHVAIDYPTHRGESALRPFFPLSSVEVQGCSDAWRWPLRKMVIAWCALAIILVAAITLRAGSS